MKKKKILLGTGVFGTIGFLIYLNIHTNKKIEKFQKDYEERVENKH